MTSKHVDLELQAFAERVQAALSLLAQEERGLNKDRPATWIKNRMTAYGASVSLPGITKWLKGESWPQVPNIKPLANALRVTIPWLLFGDGPMRPQHHLEPGEEIEGDALQWLRHFQNFTPAQRAMAKAALTAVMATWDQFMPEPQAPPSGGKHGVGWTANNK